MGAPSYDVRLLGRFVVLRGGEEIPAAAFGGRLARRLVRILAVRRGEHVPKEVLIEALWPIRPPSDPIANLEVLVSRARRGLGDPALILTGPGGYAFTTDPGCAVDADDVVAWSERGSTLLRAGRPGDALVELERSIARWGGEPLAEDLYEDWSSGHRARLRDALQAALEGGAEAALALGDARRGATLAERAAREQPLREAAWLLLVRALAAGGDRAGALEAFERFRRRSVEELGLDPSPEAAVVQASVLRGEASIEAGAGRDDTALGATRAIAQPSPDVAAPELPFTGRDEELAAALAGSARVVRVAGVSGAGKTRLIDELARRSLVPVIRGRAFVAERDEPWALARTILRDALGVDPLAGRALPELATAGLAEILPELADATPSHVDRESRRALAVEAGLRLLERVAGPGAMLLVDDLQWADATSLRLLASLAARPGALRLVVAYRPEGVAEGGSVGGFLADLAQAGAGSVLAIELGPLPPDAIEELVSDATVARALASETRPTPLVVVEALRRLEDLGVLVADAAGRRRPVRPIGQGEAVEAARSGERRAIGARLSRLDAPQRAVLETLAAMGRETPAATLAAVAGTGTAEGVAILDALARARLVRPGERGWTLAHDSLGEVAEAWMDAGHRSGLHAVIAEVLERDRAEPSEIAVHLAAAGDAAGATARYADAAELALSRFANQEARRLADAAIALTPPAAEPRLAAIRAEARARQGDLSGAKADLRGALARVVDGAERARLLTRLAMFESGSEDYEAAGGLVELALSAAGEDPRLRAEAHAVGSIVDLNLGDLERSQRRAAIALELFQANGDARGAAGILDGRAMATLLEGRIDEAIDAFEQVARLFRDAGELLRVGTPRSTRGHALVFNGRPAEGLADVDEALELSRTLGHAEGESYALWHRAEALAALDRGQEAVAAATEALAIAERIGHREWTVASLRGLGVGLEASGDLEAAIRAHRRGLDRSEGMPLFRTWAAARLAVCLVRAGRLAEAKATLALATPERSPLAAYEVRLAEVELRAAGGGDPRELAAGALALAEAGGHVASIDRLRSIAGT